MLRRGVLVCATCHTTVIGVAPARPYSQVDGERPAGVGRVRYLRAWRRGREAGDPEVTSDGRARLMTAAAWQRHGASTARRIATVVPIRANEDSDLLAELGLGKRRTG